MYVGFSHDGQKVEISHQNTIHKENRTEKPNTNVISKNTNVSRRPKSKNKDISWGTTLIRR